MLRRYSIALAFVISGLLTLIIGILSHIVANTIHITDSKFLWWLLIATFVVSLPVSYCLFTARDRAQKDSLNDLTQKPYVRFFGRLRQVDAALAVVRDPNGKSIIGIDGMGGIGKTSLARHNSL